MKDKLSKQINSHKYLARSILNRFSYLDNNTKMINYVNAKTLEIKVAPTKKFNTELGYYTNENEYRLMTYSEDKIGNVIRKLEDYRINNITNFSLSIKERTALTNYLAFQWLRSDFFSELVKERFNSDLSIEELKNIFIENEDNSKLITKYTDDMAFIIKLNNTNTQYIVNSTNSLINKDSKDYYLITIILSPNIAITYCKRDSLKKVFDLKDDEYFKVTSITDDSIIKDENLRTFCTAISSSPHFVVGRLNELKDTIDEYKQKID